MFRPPALYHRQLLSASRLAEQAAEPDQLRGMPERLASSQAGVDPAFWRDCNIFRLDKF